MRNDGIRTLVRDFVIELVIYGTLVLAYSLIVLRWLNQPLQDLFSTYLPLISAVLVIIRLCGSGMTHF